MRKRNKRRIYVIIVVSLISVVGIFFLMARELSARYKKEMRMDIPSISVIPRMETVSLPVPLHPIYDGTEKYCFDEIGTQYTIQGTEKATKNGEYSVTLSLKDTSHMQWEDGTREDKTLLWSIDVCEIGTVRYATLTRAFDTERSTSEMPIRILTNFSEEALNAKGTDYLVFDSHFIEGNGVVITNEGTLWCLDHVSLLSSGEDTKNYACLLNNGEVHLTEGDLTTIYNGTATGGAEAYGIWNRDGCADIRNAEIYVNGKTLAADGFYIEGGNVTISECDVLAEVNTSYHGAYAIYAEGGSIDAEKCTFAMQNPSGFAYGMAGTGGTIRDLRNSIHVEGFADSSVFSLMGPMSLISEEGDHSVICERDFNGIQVDNGAILSIVSGTYTFSHPEKGDFGSVTGIHICNGEGTIDTINMLITARGTENVYGFSIRKDSTGKLLLRDSNTEILSDRNTTYILYANGGKTEIKDGTYRVTGRGNLYGFTRFLLAEAEVSVKSLRFNEDGAECISKTPSVGLTLSYN